MLSTKCPGQDMRYWTADDVHEEKCPRCGELIEFFKTDIRLRCRKCKTKVANPRFNMGCAHWCAYAEQCLGPAAKGIETISLQGAFEEELERLAGNKPGKVKKVKDILAAADQRCREEGVDMLPVKAAIVILYLMKLNCVDDTGTFFKNLEHKHAALPREAAEKAEGIVNCVIKGNLQDKEAGITSELLNQL